MSIIILSEESPSHEESSNVVLNVGGTRYEVARTTLDRYPDSMLATLVSKRWTANNANRPIFIDRDGSRFQFVLDFLRDGKVHLPASVSAEALRADFAYYGLPENAHIGEGGLGLSRIAQVMKELKAKLEEYQDKVTATTVLIEALTDATNHQTNQGRAKRPLPEASYPVPKYQTLQSKSKAKPSPSPTVKLPSSEVVKKRVMEVAEELNLEVTAAEESSSGSIICRFN